MDLETSNAAPSITFHRAINRTINYHPDHPSQNNSPRRQQLINFLSGGIYQSVLILIFMAAMNSSDSLVLGIAFLEIEPSQFLCYYDPNTPENPSTEPEWVSCSKDDICSKELPRDRYRGDPADPEYIHNWVEKYDTLCKPKSKLGLFGLYFFVGILSTILVLPKISDMYGRRLIFIQTMVCTLIV